MQSRALREYAAPGWTIALQVREVNSGATRREAREKVLEAARRRKVVLVWRFGSLGPAGSALKVGPEPSNPFRGLSRCKIQRARSCAYNPTVTADILRSGRFRTGCVRNCVTTQAQQQIVRLRFSQITLPRTLVFVHRAPSVVTLFCGCVGQLLCGAKGLRVTIFDRFQTLHGPLLTFEGIKVFFDEALLLFAFHPI